MRPVRSRVIDSACGPYMFMIDAVISASNRGSPAVVRKPKSRTAVGFQAEQGILEAVGSVPERTTLVQRCQFPHACGGRSAARARRTPVTLNGSRTHVAVRCIEPVLERLAGQLALVGYRHHPCGAGGAVGRRSQSSRAGVLPQARLCSRRDRPGRERRAGDPHGPRCPAQRRHGFGPAGWIAWFWHERLPHSELPRPVPAVVVRTRAAGSRYREVQSSLSQAIRARGSIAARDMA